MPMEAGPHVGAALAAGLADEPIFDVGEPDVVRPLIAADRYRVAAVIVGALDQQTANAGFAHFAECDLLRASRAPKNGYGF